MEFYLTSKRTGARLRIPLLPDRLNVKTGASVVSLSIIKKMAKSRYPVGSTLCGVFLEWCIPVRPTGFRFVCL